METGHVLVLDDWSQGQLRKAPGVDDLTDPGLRDLWPLWCLVGWEYEWWDEEEEPDPWPEPPPGVDMDRYVQVPRIESYEAYHDMRDNPESTYWGQLGPEACSKHSLL